MKAADWLGSMAARVFALLLVGVVAAAALAFAASDLQRRASERRGREQRVADRVVDLAGFLARTPLALRPSLLGAGPEGARWAEAAPADEPADGELVARLAPRLGAASSVHATIPSGEACREGPPPPPPPGGAQASPGPPPADSGPRERPRPPPPECRRVTLSLPGGERVSFLLPMGPRPPKRPPTPFSPTLLAMLAVAAAALAFVTARLVTAPLRRLSEAAGALGRDLDRAPLAVEGPTEVRRAARSFNAMQTRLRQREAERTHMLAAITHDLQTPLTRMRLRVEKVGDPALREALLADQAAMRELIRDGLDLARAAGDPRDALRRLDVDSLLQSLRDDATEAGAEVTLAGGGGGIVLTRPEALKRCVANLLDNAIKHAGDAELLAEREGATVVLHVRDRGPGIPKDRLAAVLDPFVRLEDSRSRDTGGTGLGLTVARLMAERSSATLSLANRPGGGLDATVRLDSAPAQGEKR